VKVLQVQQDAVQVRVLLSVQVGELALALVLLQVLVLALLLQPLLA
jgi:hypothetical protein